MQLRYISTISLNLALGAGLIIVSTLLASCGAAKEPEAAFKARCGRCHGVRDVQNWGRQRRDAAARQAWLDQFLRLHYPPPEAERALVIDYIQSTIAGRAAPQ
jgi:hypothetical protein